MTNLRKISHAHVRRMEKSLKDDEHFHFWYHGLRVALLNTVVSPVVIGNMYWDCYEDEEKALALMERRIRDHGDDINRHLDIFKQTNEKLKTIDSRLIAKDRASVRRSVEETIDLMNDYGALVRNHKLKPEHFLMHPYTNGGHLEIYGCFVVPLVFNPERSEEGFKAGLDGLGQAAREFGDRTANIPYMIIRDATTVPVDREYLDRRILITQNMLSSLGSKR